MFGYRVTKAVIFPEIIWKSYDPYIWWLLLYLKTIQYSLYFCEKRPATSSKLRYQLSMYYIINIIIVFETPPYIEVCRQNSLWSQAFRKWISNQNKYHLRKNNVPKSFTLCLVRLIAACNFTWPGCENF